MDIRTTEIVCPGGMPAYFACPAGKGPFPTVILMHERYGLVPHTKDLARRSATDGFATLAPDFFYRHPDKQRLNAGIARYDLSDPEAVELINTALSALKDQPAADLARVAVSGYCQTGRHPLVFAAETKIAAAVVWYGAASRREWDVNTLQPRALERIIAALECPVFGAFGADDHIISVADVRQFRDCLESRIKSYDIHLYADAPHGWLNDTMPGRYRKAQADTAWAAQQTFLRQAFAGAWKPSHVRWQFDSEFGVDYDFSKNRRQE